MHQFLVNATLVSKSKWIAVALLFSLVGAWALWKVHVDEHVPIYPVGLMKRHYVDPERQSWDTREARPLNALVWYPAAAGTEEKEWTVSIFHAGHNLQGATLSPTPAKLPLVVLSHGTEGSAVSLSWLAEYLAQHGFIVAAVSHHGNTVAELNPRIEGALVWWDRAQDVRVLVDRLLDDPWIGSRIDTNRIGVAGFAIGGYTALASVGVRLSRSQYDTYCVVNGNCKLPPDLRTQYTDADAFKLMHDDEHLNHALERMEDSYEDNRIHAAFVMAPVAGFAMTFQSLAAVHVPVHLVVGKDDDQATPDVNARPMAKQIPSAKLDVLPKGGHYVFLPSCTEQGKTTSQEICNDGPGIDRAAIHAMVSADALTFFRQALE